MNQSTDQSKKSSCFSPRKYVHEDQWNYPMPKSKKGKKSSKSDGGEKEAGPESDPFVLFRNYSRQCESVGIGINETVKRALCQNENPISTSQLLIGPDNESSPLLGPGGCRSLVSAILGDCNDCDATKYTAFREIRIWRSNLGNEGASAIARLLIKCDGNEYNIQYLELLDNDIGSQGALALGRSLCCGMNQTLLTLKLDYNTRLGSDGLAALSRGLRLNSTLKILSLRFCDIGEDGGSLISGILAFPNSSIISLDLEGNRLGGSGLLGICPGLKVNSTIQCMSLTDINLMPVDVSALESLGEVLGLHQSLTEITLVRNVIGNEGGLALLKGLETNKRINCFQVDSSLRPDIYRALSRMTVSEGSKKKKKKKKKKK